MTKNKIIKRLIESNTITDKEAIILMDEVVEEKPKQIPYHKICGCNICQCTMGSKMIDVEQ